MKNLIYVIVILISFEYLNAETVAIEPVDTDGDGYRNISTLEHLRWFAETESAADDKFELDNDIDAKDTESWNLGDHDNDPYTPVVAKGWINKYAFAGSFEGNGHTISNLYINTPKASNCGFFSYLIDNARVYDLHIKDAQIISGRKSGIFVGRIYHWTSTGIEVINCSSSGEISSTNNYYGEIGGFVGFLSYGYGNLLIKDCESDATVKGYTKIGGFCGSAEQRTISSCLFEGCKSSGNVFSEKDAGGFISSIVLNESDIRIKKCQSNTNVNVSSESSYLSAGFIGSIHIFEGTAIVSSCISKGDIRGVNKVSAFISYFYGNSSCKIENCYSKANVYGENIVSGFSTIQRSGVEIRNCYSVTKLESDNEKYGFSSIDLKDNIRSCYWDTEYSNLDESIGGYGRTSEEMKEKINYIGWDFVNIWDIDPNINDGYPYLRESQSVGIEENYEERKEVRIVLYPNPATDYLNISWKEMTIGVIDIAIIDIYGKEYNLYTGLKQDNLRLDISEFSSGRYYIRVSSNTISETLPLLIE